MTRKVQLGLVVLIGPEGVKFDLNLPLVVDADGDLDVINSEENDNARARARYLSCQT